LPHHCRIITYTGHQSLAPKMALFFWGVGGATQREERLQERSAWWTFRPYQEGEVGAKYDDSKESWASSKCTPSTVYSCTFNVVLYKFFGKDSFFKWL
jgi:hypothetical protein